MLAVPSLRRPLVTGAAAAAACLVLAVLGASAASASTVWLCRPGMSPDPCTPSLTTTVFTPSFTKVATRTVETAKNPRIDCFYVYPTVSDQKTPNATLHIDDTEQSIALYQAARYSQLCRVYAPMYRQITIAGLDDPSEVTAADVQLAYSGVLAAWKDYLAHYNHGRGFVLIGHSQGSAMLIALMRQQIDDNPAVRKRLVSAIILGGNVLVKPGTGAGGDFQHIPACTSETQLHCVIAWSTFDQTPPADTIFGAPNSSLGELTPDVPQGDFQVLCTNPAALGGGSGLLDPIFPSAPFAPGSEIAAGNALIGLKTPPASTTFESFPGAYSATCSSAGGDSTLQITAQGGAPTLNPSPTPAWGLHLVDANIAQGNLLGIVGSEAGAYAKR